MFWVKVFVIVTVLSSLQAQEVCSQLIRWTHILQSLKDLSHNISHECVHLFENEVPCDPLQMLSELKHTETILANVLKRAGSIYKRTPKSHALTEDFLIDHYRLTSCATHISFSDLEPVTVCFDKLEEFLIHKKDDENCAWEVVNDRVKRILQRLQNRTLRRR